MPRDYKLRLDDILGSISKIFQYVEGMNLDDFNCDNKTQDAVIRNLQIIAEASKHIPDKLKEKHTSIPWAEIIGFRNIVVHQYFGVTIDIVWHTIYNELPALEKTCKELLDSSNCD